MTAPSAAKKTAAKKAPAKRTAAKKAVAPAEPNVDEVPAPAGGKATDPTITWRGRVMRVQAIGVAQAGVWERTRALLLGAATAGDTLEAGRAVKLLARGIGLVRSVLADDDDKEFVEDQILDDPALDLTRAMEEIVTPAIAAVVATQGGKATAPRTGPVKAARLRR